MKFTSISLFNVKHISEWLEKFHDIHHHTATHYSKWNIRFKKFPSEARDIIRKFRIKSAETSNIKKFQMFRGSKLYSLFFWQEVDFFFQNCLIKSEVSYMVHKPNIHYDVIYACITRSNANKYFQISRSIPRFSAYN